MDREEEREFSLNTMIKKIEEPASQDSVHINLREPEIDDDAAEALENAITHSKRVKTLRFTKISMPTWIASQLARAAIFNPNIKTIDFPVWGTTNSPGQMPVMELEQNLNLLVESLDKANLKNLIAFTYFKKLNNEKSFKTIKTIDNRDHEVPYIHEDIWDKHLVPFLISEKKTIKL